jgi:DNA-binding MarR family transcriptional regulator
MKQSKQRRPYTDDDRVRRAVHRTIDQLETQGLVETFKAIGESGRLERMVRLTPAGEAKKRAG